MIKKLYIPIRDFPNYNFIGLIIGPRGNTQKRLERETNCKISIRGKGSVKEGRSRRGHAEEDDELHVLVTGDREEDVACAEKIISDLLVPQEDDSANEWKMAQLRELALINGTVAVWWHA